MKPGDLISSWPSAAAMASLAAFTFLFAPEGAAQTPLPAAAPPPPAVGGPNQALMPQNRRTLVVETNEINPFGQQAETLPDMAVEQQESEESRLRKAVGKFPVGGISGNAGGYTILLGSLRLKAGDDLPVILPGQSEHLRVVSLTEKSIVLGFLESDGKVGDRTFALQIQTTPSVRYLLPSQSGVTTPESPLQGVYAPPPNNARQW